VTARPGGKDRGSAADALQHDDRDAATCFLLVIIVNREVIGDFLEQVVALVAFGDRGPDIERFGRQFYRRPWVCDEIVVPGRIGRRPGLGGDDDVAIAILDVSGAVGCADPRLG
jgi:hypothetical protein